MDSSNPGDTCSRNRGRSNTDYPGGVKRYAKYRTLLQRTVGMIAIMYLSYFWIYRGG
jgi:hypothetical protein